MTLFVKNLSFTIMVDGVVAIILMDSCVPFELPEKLGLEDRLLPVYISDSSMFVLQCPLRTVVCG